jgi:hypothetical protein
MRLSLARLFAIAVLAGLCACEPIAADWTGTALENFDPSQVRMLPDNPYQATKGARRY